MKNKKAFIFVKFSCISLVLFFIFSFYWSKIEYAMPSVLGIVSLLFAASYFIFGAMCSFLIPEKPSSYYEQNTTENQ